MYVLVSNILGLVYGNTDPPDCRTEHNEYVQHLRICLTHGMWSQDGRTGSRGREDKCVSPFSR